MNIEYIRKLPTPKEVKNAFPVDKQISEIIQQRRSEISAVFSNQDERIVLLIGPCSADDKDSVLRYVDKLAVVQEKVEEKIILIPRVYTAKPRTTGKGYKGLIHQPNPKAEPNLYEGIAAAREMHLEVLTSTGLISADELLYPDVYRYYDDLLAYVAIGARATEDQQHRLVSSGINVPVGMKNPTSGDLTVMMNSITAGQSPQDFILGGWECRSKGNSLCHAILRGFNNEAGETFSNSHYESILHLCDLYRERSELVNPGFVIDCNHANSHKDPFAQPRIVREIMGYCNYNPLIRALFKGFMIESYILDGRQEYGEVAGQSITDACLGWEKTERLIYEIAEAV